jgi:selT/selW/selH-like putative selenoprotein
MRVRASLVAGAHLAAGAAAAACSLAVPGALIDLTALSAAGIAEPRWAAAARENRLALFVAYFVVNAITAKLRSTGAYEVELNGKPVWSKIAQGGVAPLEVIARAISQETGWKPSKL